MNNSHYIDRLHDKLEAVLPYYAERIWKDIGKAETVYAMKTQDHLRTPPARCEMSVITPGTVWGGEYDNIWLSCDVTVPVCAAGAVLGTIPEAEAVETLCFKDGVPAGIINSKNQFLGGMHSAMFALKDAVPGTALRLDFECYAWHRCLGTQPYTSYEEDETAPGDFNKTYHGIRIVMLDQVINDFVFDLATVLQLARLPGENYMAMKAHQCLLDAFPYLIQDVRSASEEDLHDACRKVCTLLAPALKKTGGDASRGYVGVIGHSHMDTAWLWPVEETIRKCARTYAQALTFMDLYPNYTFIQSSALHLDWMRQYYPAIFSEIQRRVAEGRYEPNGGVWVECDCNIAGGEAMVRHFLYGQRFTEKYFGYRSDSFWLPDTFGYNGAIPQIMQKSGVKYFYTTKLSWNDLNRFPADTFVWRGIDGSEVITHLNRTHFIPDVKTLTEVITQNYDKSSCDMRLAAYGFGDGGGGPTHAMLEFLKRSEGLDGMPVVEETTISKFMHKVEEHQDRLPVYDGELYLELHRGTLTKMHPVKRNNRLAEIALHNLELFNVLSGQAVSPKRDEYYHILLKNQFHDILPGTCIPKVYELEVPEMEALIRDVNADTQAYAAGLAKADEKKLSLYNPLSFRRSGIAVLDGSLGLEGVETQCYTDYDGKEKTAFHLTADAMSAAVVTVTAPTASASAFKAEGSTLATPYYRATFDENGYLSSLYDLEAGREVHNTAGAPLGTLWFGEDMPRAWDNWDIDDDVFLKLRPVTAMQSRNVVSDGAVEYRIRTVYAVGKESTATVDTVFYAANRRIDYQVKLDWHERHALLKAGFDVAIRSAFVKNEIQFGYMDRPTTRNNTIEEGKFEVCNHKWSDLSEIHYGVAILNDCKYGMSADGSNLCLTLHKGGCRPDPFTDMGIQEMTYALLPHSGPFDAETVIHPAYELNYAPVVIPGVADLTAPFTLSNPGIVCEAVKNAEDVEGAYVLRLYEAERNHSACTLTLRNAKRVWLTNMLEEKEAELPLEDGKVALSFTPFEIKTILVEC